MSSRFHRTLPAHPDLDQQKKLAKELLRAYAEGDPEALARMRAELPDKPSLVLADAQYVLAREYGFANWKELSVHIEAARANAQTPLDRIHAAFSQRDAPAVRRLFESHPELRALINEPVFPFDAPALVHFASHEDVELIDVLLLRC
jgi:hypothetical protein